MTSPIDHGTTTSRPAGSARVGADAPVTTRAVSARSGGSEPTGDRVHWGAVWAGTLVTVPTFLVLQLLFVAFGWLDLGTGQSAAASIVSAVLALIAFAVGGLLAGTTVRGSGTEAGLLHGVLVWALATVGVLAVGLIGGGALAGNLGVFATQVSAPPATAALAQTARDAAGWGALWLGASVIAAALGGTSGAKAHR